MRRSGAFLCAGGWALGRLRQVHRAASWRSSSLVDGGMARAALQGLVISGQWTGGISFGRERGPVRVGWLRATDGRDARGARRRMGIVAHAIGPLLGGAGLGGGVATFGPGEGWAPATGVPGDRNGRGRGMMGPGPAADREPPPIRLHHALRDRGSTCAPAGRSDIRRPAAVLPFPFRPLHFPVRISPFTIR